MMLVVLVVTAATLFFASRSLYEQQTRILGTQFQANVRSSAEAERVRMAAVQEKCRILARSVRLRAALEEHDDEDLYRNAATELRDLLATRDSLPGDRRASFVRLIGVDGKVISPCDQEVGLTDLPALNERVAELAKETLRASDFQASGFVRVQEARVLSALQHVVLTRLLDWNGDELGILALGFPIADLGTSSQEREFRSGFFIGDDLFINGLSAPDREQLAEKIRERRGLSRAGEFDLELGSGSHLVFLGPREPSSAFRVCIFPMMGFLREAAHLRWKILGFGAGTLLAGFAVSLLLARGLAKPVDKIVAGSVDNARGRRRAEENLAVTNRELEKALEELRATQQQIIQQERLSAIGQMASGIAHDFNNTLTPILGFSELLLERDDMDLAQRRRFLEMLRTSAMDAASVVNRLREFYRPAKTDEKFPVVEIAKIVRQAISLTEPRWKTQAQANGVTIDVRGESKGEPRVCGEEPALRELLTNLIFNAVDAMPSGGRVELRAEVAGGQVILQVKDTGSGMTEETRRRCLEPFYSTKGERGTGLGLSMVYGIVERHRGEIDIATQLGVGTTFTIRLPAANEKAAHEPRAGEIVPFRRGLSVLVVDDDARVCEVVMQYLEGDGHEVVIAHHGRAAVEAVAKRQFDVVFLDRAMPELSGDQAAELIKKTHPELPIILLTGFGALIEVTGSRPQAVDAVVAKPVTLGTIRQTIERLLHAA